MRKLVRPILVASKEITTIWSYKERRLYYNQANFNDVDDTTYYQLILVSLDSEEIVVGDLGYINIGVNGTIGMVSYDTKYRTWDLTTEDNVHYPFTTKEYINKVIVTQTQIPESYIQQFIEEYNSGVVKDVVIEMEENGVIYPEMTDNTYSEYAAKCIYKPKLTNGFITIIEKDLPIVNFKDATLQDLYDRGFPKIEELESNVTTDGWEARSAIKKFPELPHTINSLRELRRYYIDGLQEGYDVRKKEESNRITKSIDDLNRESDALLNELLEKTKKNREIEELECGVIFNGISDPIEHAAETYELLSSIKSNKIAFSRGARSKEAKDLYNKEAKDLYNKEDMLLFAEYCMHKYSNYNCHQDDRINFLKGYDFDLWLENKNK